MSFGTLAPVTGPTSAQGPAPRAQAAPRLRRVYGCAMPASVAATSRVSALRVVACAAGLLAASACASRFDVEATPLGEPTVAPSASTTALAEPPPADAEAGTAPDDARADVRVALDASRRDADTVDADAPDAASTRKRVFVTSASYRGVDISTLGGASGALGADALCAKVAAAAGLTGRFDAWISDMNANAADRLRDPGPFYDVSRRTLLFDKNPALGPPLAALADENGGALGIQRFVWTGSSASGVKTNDCDKWSRTGSMGTVGNASAPASWANASLLACDSTRRLYCFER